MPGIQVYRRCRLEAGARFRRPRVSQMQSHRIAVKSLVKVRELRGFYGGGVS
jgi:hypothetical protein